VDRRTVRLGGKEAEEVHSMLRPSSRKARRGAVVPLTAIMLVMLMAFLALTIDLGYITLVHCELQNAADAAALAGASQVLDKNLLKGTNNQSTAITSVISNCNTQAMNYSSYNKGGGVSLLLDAGSSNSSNESSKDVVVGYFSNPSDKSQTMTRTDPANGPVPNAVQITVHRDTNGNGSLPLFFAKALGMSTSDLKISATACCAGEVKGFKIQTAGYTTCKLLPYTLNYDTWMAAVVGVNGNAPTGPDTFARTTPNSSTSPPANVTSGSDGIHEVKLFPLTNGSGGSGVEPGNFGQVDIGSNNNSTNDVKRQILYGPNAADLGTSNFPNGCQLGADATSPTGYSMSLQGDTGVSAGVETEFQSIIGQARIIPLYKSVSGNGNNAQFTIVKFVGVTVLEVDLHGSLSDKHITIQPCFCIDPNTVGGGSSSTSSYVVKPISLCR